MMSNANDFKNEVSILIFEPFLALPTLPCLAPALLKTKLKDSDTNSKIIYTALEIFHSLKLYKNTVFMKILNNISTQILEMLFTDDIDLIDNISEEWIIENFPDIDVIKFKDTLKKYRVLIQDKTKEIVVSLLSDKIKIICFSLTFGDYNYFNYISRVIKKYNQNIKIIVGGSSFNENSSKQLIDYYAQIDFIVCDETFNSFIGLTQSIINNKSYNNELITSKQEICKKKQFCINLSELNIPDYEDFFIEIDRLHIDRSKITLAYEMSRGCWWAEVKPCKMCGFFGDRKDYSSKLPIDVANDLRYLSKKYGTRKFRFTDLVQPKDDYIHELLKLLDKNYELFIELRPNLNYEELQTLKSLGINMIQVGIESFDDEILYEINKGTSSLNNLRMLRDLSTLKINTYWNYLYGFRNDKVSWYEDSIRLFKKLHHLYPPIARKIWVNKFSETYYETDILEMINSYNHKNSNNNIDFFFQEPISKDFKLLETYQNIHKSINDWIDDYNNGEKFQLNLNNSKPFLLKRHRGLTNIIELDDLRTSILINCLNPIQIDCLFVQIDSFEPDIIRKNINFLLSIDALVYINDSYLTIVTIKNNLKRTNKTNLAILSPSDLYN